MCAALFDAYMQWQQSFCALFFLLLHVIHPSKTNSYFWSHQSTCFLHICLHKRSLKKRFYVIHTSVTANHFWPVNVVFKITSRRIDEKGWILPACSLKIPSETVKENENLKTNKNKMWIFFQEKFHKLVNVFNRLADINFDIVDVSRELLKEGKIIKISARNGEKYERYLYLVCCFSFCFKNDNNVVHAI